MSHEPATIAEEEYLQTIYWLMEAGLPITGANIARAMQLAPPTVHEMLGRLEEDGYIVRADDKSLRFSAEGETHAKAIVRRHRLIERFLTDVVGVAWDDVHEEAERLEHTMSPAFEKWMISSIGDARTCPHGHPIDPGQREPGVPLADVQQGAEVEVLRLENEAEDVLHYLKGAGVRTGLKGKVASTNGQDVSIEADGDVVTITRSVAETVSVKANPSPEVRTALPEQLVLGRDRYGR
jgi:DtxR family Mn-dependent transcriptional regulator